MTTYRLFGWLGGSLQAGRRCLLVCLAALALGSCASPGKPATVTDGGNRDATSGSASDAVNDRPDARSADVALSPACTKDAGPPTKTKGESCMCDGECRTGHCIDGVCCSSVCDDRCKACNLPNTLGECTLVAAGGAPTDPSECAQAEEATCGQDGKCDGKGGCRLHVTNTACDRGTCEGDGLVGLKTCDGAGHCEGDMSQTCAPYSCDPKTNQCDRRCTTSAQCALGQQCSAGSCGLKFNGYPCDVNDECASGHCADGVCCNVACSGPCVSCGLAGALGRCQLIPEGQKSEDCSEEPQSSCGTNGYCDGAGACALWPAETTPCATSSCVGSVLLNATAVCDGKGTCQEPQLIDCSPFLCVEGACTSRCRSDDDCEPGHACVFALGAAVGSCGKRKPGQPCESADECESGQCVDGVCCETSCEGACRSCALPGSPGRCVNLPAGAPDRRQVCADEGSAACAHNGLCDGNGGCQLYPEGTKCGSGSCVLGSFTDAPTCNQAGQCVAPPSRSCSPYVCNGDACYSSCTKDGDCVPPNTCVNNRCGKGDPGAACSSGSDCDSGFCAQGVCCNSACTDACRACNLPATMGLCVAVPNGTPDPQEKCQVTDKTTCGTTGACWWGTCAYVESGTVCKAASCAGTSSLTPASTCDGAGSCVTPSDVSCGSFNCRNNSCPATCANDNECVAPATCVNHSCGLKANGASCTAGTQCGSGFCTEGVCCDSPCSDALVGSLCMSCRVAGRIGTCTPVPDGQTDPKRRCAASDPASGNCSNDGTCNGRGACRPWSTTTGCRQATCVVSTFTPAANCDGVGRCPTVPSFACDPYRCNQSSPSCLTTCTSSDDCLAGVTCLQTTNRCGTKLPNGQLCKANTDCVSGNCVGGQRCCPENYCVIDSGQCLPAGTLNPDNACQQCTPSTTPTAWSPRGGGEVCRAANGGCDVAEVCDGTGAPCPANGFAPATTECRAAAPGGCDVAENCTGSSATCPANLFLPSRTECRAAAPGGCDVAENCTGSSATCPDDVFLPSTTECRAAAPGGCDVAENCTGSSATCPANSFRPSDYVCRAVAGDTCGVEGTCCDVAETCTGSSASCPADELVPASAAKVCRPAADLCDVAETCTGSTANCPTNSFRPSDYVCRAVAGDTCGVEGTCCDVAETCTGSSASCPADVVVPASATKVCRPAADLCDVAETCTGSTANCPTNSFRPSDYVCRAVAGDTCGVEGTCCDVAETCTGSTASCPADAFVPASDAKVCRPATNVCDVAETCAGTSANCPGDEQYPECDSGAAAQH